MTRSIPLKALFNRADYFWPLRRRAERAFLFILRAIRFLLALRKAPELLVLWELLEVFLAGREASNLLVLLELLGVSLALGEPTAGRPVGTSRMLPLALATHCCLLVLADGLEAA